MANRFESEETGIASYRHVFEVIKPLEHIEDRIVKQMDNYINLRNQVQETHGFPRSPEEKRFLGTLFLDIVDERNARASDLASQEVQEAEAIADRIFPLPLYGFLCIDSRVTATTVLGVVAAGRITSVPMADVFEFEQSEDEGLVLRDNAAFDEQLEQAFGQDNTISQILDSHHGCAARAREENEKGREPEDHGLLEDVVRKRRIARAMIEHVENNYPDKTIIPIQTSFDPHTGWMDMGLELDVAVQQAQERGGFDQELLGELRGSRQIINTKNLLQDSRIRQLFEERIIPNLDWGLHDQYRESANLFWKNIAAMKEEGLMDVVKEHVLNLYADRSDVEIEQRAVMLAASAYNGFLLNSGRRHYPYAEHKESCVVVSEGGKGPFIRNSSFSVSRGANELSANMRLAGSIVRDNRKAGRIVDYTGSYRDTDQYRAAPVPTMLEVVIRNDENVDWNHAAQIDWSDIPENWDSMNTPAFLSYLYGKGIVSEEIMNVISLKDSTEKWNDDEFFKYLKTLKMKLPPLALGMNALREDMKRIYSSQYRIHKFLEGGQIEVLPVISDRHRKIQAIPPFIHKGYKRQSID